MSAADDEYEELIGRLRVFGWEQWFRLDEVVGLRLNEEADRFASRAVARLQAEAKRMEKECKKGCCLHAEGLRLASSYVAAEVGG